MATTHKWTMSGWFTVTGKNGALVRAEARMDSAKVEELAKGTLVRIEETATLPEGKERGRLTHPLAGWITVGKGLEPAAAPAPEAAEPAAETAAPEVAAAAPAAPEAAPEAAAAAPAPAPDDDDAFLDEDESTWCCGSLGGTCDMCLYLGGLPLGWLGGLGRTTRTLTATASIAAAYKKHETDKASTGKERDEKLRALHEKTGAELLELFEKNGGFQIKFGQILASQTKMLPKEITDALRPLQDGAPERPWAAVDAVLTKAYGGLPGGRDAVLASVDERPLAAASVAQVHGAVLTPEAAAKFGAPANIVLKVRHADVGATMEKDLSLFGWVTTLVGAVFKNVDFTWVKAFITESIEQELDFTNEAAQCEKLGGFLARARPGAGVAVKRSGFMLGDLPSVRAPRVVRGLSNTGLLAMERVEGCRPTDGAAIRDMGATPVAVALGLLEAFAECIFLHGYVHGDLHPGNLIVAPKPETKAKCELVLIDHGLHVAVPRDFRAAYCRLWNALAEGDEAGLKAAAAALGVGGDDYRAFPWLLGYMPYDNWLKRKMPSARDVARMRRTGELDAVGDQGFYNRMPYVLVVMLRTNMQVAAILFENKGWAISLFQVMSTHARLGLALIESGPVDDAEANGCPYAWIAEHKPKAEADVANAVKYEKS